MSSTDVDLYILWLLIEQKVVHHLLVMCSISMQADNRKNIKHFFLFMLPMVFYFHLEMDTHYFFDIFNS